MIKKNPYKNMYNSDSDTNTDIDIENTKKYKKKDEKIKKYNIEKSFNNALEWMEEFKEDNYVIEKKIYDTLPWVEKFRPQYLNDIVDHESIVDTLKKFIQKNQLPHMLMCGPPGTGKTSTIMSCAKELYKDNYSIMVLDINASEERGIDVVRNKIKSFILTKGVFINQNGPLFKLVILDEADAMTADAQSMLINVMEKYTLNVRFCLICNYIKKIDPAVQSRCMIFKFSPLNKLFIQNKIKNIANIMKFNVSNDGINAIIKMSKGDMRKVINILQATHMAYTNVNELNVNKCVGYPIKKDIELIYQLLLNKNIKECYFEINNIIVKNGYALIDIIHELFNELIEKYMAHDNKIKNIPNLISCLRNIETNLTMCQNEHIQLSGLISSFKLNVL